jgi:hypothetical protein
MTMTMMTSHRMSLPWRHALLCVMTVACSYSQYALRTNGTRLRCVVAKALSLVFCFWRPVASWDGWKREKVWGVRWHGATPICPFEHVMVVLFLSHVEYVTILLLMVGGRRALDYTLPSHGFFGGWRHVIMGWWGKRRRARMRRKRRERSAPSTSRVVCQVDGVCNGEAGGKGGKGEGGRQRGGVGVLNRC